MATHTETASTTGAIAGGSPTIYVTDMDRAVRFYTDHLGLRLQFRAGGHFAMIDAGKGLSIGLHPAGKDSPTPGTPGAIQLGLAVTQPLADVVRLLQGRGVTFKDNGGSPIVDDGQVKLAYLLDPDGNEIYLIESKWK